MSTRAMNTVRGTAVAALLLLPAFANAEPIKLKLAMFSSDKEMTWVTTIKPWADAVNTAGKGIIEIDEFPNGALDVLCRSSRKSCSTGWPTSHSSSPASPPGAFPTMK